MNDRNFFQMLGSTYYIIELITQVIYEYNCVDENIYEGMVFCDDAIDKAWPLDLGRVGFEKGLTKHLYVLKCCQEFIL